MLTCGLFGSNPSGQSSPESQSRRRTTTTTGRLSRYMSSKPWLCQPESRSLIAIRFSIHGAPSSTAAPISAIRLLLGAFPRLPQPSVRPLLTGTNLFPALRLEMAGTGTGAWRRTLKRRFLLGLILTLLGSIFVECFQNTVFLFLEWENCCLSYKEKKYIKIDY